jgi:hypothetical protein
MQFPYIQKGLLTAAIIGISLFSYSYTLAKIGVGIGTGKIGVDEPLKAGEIYNLPALTVLNTGDESSEYGVSIEYHEGQEARADMGLRPERNWFRFSPATFSLAPSESKVINITLTLPVKITPGNYFAYLEAHPVRESVAGVTSVNIAAATKLYFTVAPSNIFYGLYYRVIGLYARYHPWDTGALVLIFVVLLLRFIGKK